MAINIVMSSWSVGNKYYSNKLSAVKEASKSKENVDYHFYDEIWAHSKSFTPSKSLEELYKARAQQLRDRYDFLILNYSAGADSYNILETFVRNKIKLDAIQIKWPMTATKFHSPSFNTSSFNLLSEWELTILPDIKRISHQYPDIKIFVKDWNTEIDVSKLESVNQLISLGDIYRFNTTTKNYNSLTGVIWGIDKPLIFESNNKFGFFFKDSIVSVGQSLDHNPQELFYWAYDMPELVLTQAYHLASYFKNTKKLAYTLDKDNNIEDIRTASIEVLYPFRRNVFQVSKYLLENKEDWDSWLYSSELKDTTEQWNNYINEVLSDIDQKFCVMQADKRIALRSMNTQVFWLNL